ncbi:glycosyl transferase [Sphingomonas sp. DBB INV C78]|uniref:glycosyltransferase family 4 protein n=1 Tax=Sphingomonas sp. DBB INV C78 TaxID=3349434 RepID=UPI0036D327BA
MGVLSRALTVVGLHRVVRRHSGDGVVPPPREEDKGTKRDRIRISFLLPALDAGGAERVVNIVANDLVARGYDVSVVTLSSEDHRSYFDYDEHVDLVRIGIPPCRRPLLSSLSMTFRRVKALRDALNALQPDVVVSFLTRMNILTLLAFGSSSVPIIVSERNNPRKQRFGFMWSWLRACLYPQAFGLVTMTREAMHAFPNYMRRREWVVPNPVKPRAAVSRNVDRSRTISAVGRLVPQKGLDLLLLAYSKVATDYPDWRLVIWGEGPERGSLEYLRQSLDLADRVSLPGVSYQPGGWVDRSSMFVLSSRYEGWGNALMEALAAGLPVVAFDCDWGPRTMIDHGVNGWLVPNGDVDALAEALRGLMADPSLRATLGQAAQGASERYSVESVTQQWIAIIDEALVARRASVARTFDNSRVEWSAGSPV